MVSEWTCQPYRPLCFWYIWFEPSEVAITFSLQCVIVSLRLCRWFCDADTFFQYRRISPNTVEIVANFECRKADEYSVHICSIAISHFLAISFSWMPKTRKKSATVQASLRRISLFCECDPLFKWNFDPIYRKESLDRYSAIHMKNCDPCSKICFTWNPSITKIF